MRHAIKQHIIDLVEQQPDNATYEEILHTLAVDLLASKGVFETTSSGDPASHEEIVSRIRGWLELGE